MKERLFTLNSPRLHLRPFQPSDAEDMVSLLTDERIKRTYMIPDFATPEEALALFDRLMRLSYQANSAVYAICLKEGGAPVGFVNNTEYDLENRRCEVGYVIAPAHQNRGYATEAVRALIAELFRQGFPAVQAFYFEGNIASRRVMEKCGMVSTGEVARIPYRGKIHRAHGMEITYKAPHDDNFTVFAEKT